MKRLNRKTTASIPHAEPDATETSVHTFRGQVGEPKKSFDGTISAEEINSGLPARIGGKNPDPPKSTISGKF